MALNTTHFILISVVGVVFLAFLSLVVWLVVILYRRRRVQKAAQQYQLHTPGDTQSGDVTDSGVATSAGPSRHVTTVTLTNQDFVQFPGGRQGNVYENPDALIGDEEDDDSGHGTYEDYDKIHIDVVETNIEGVYARPQKSTLKKNSTPRDIVLNSSTMDKNVKFSEKLQTVIGDLATPKGSVRITEWDPKT